MAAPLAPELEECAASQLLTAAALSETYVDDALEEPMPARAERTGASEAEESVESEAVPTAAACTPSADAAKTGRVYAEIISDDVCKKGGWEKKERKENRSDVGLTTEKKRETRCATCLAEQA